MIKEKFFIGEPYEFKKGVLIYPPKVKDIVSNDKFSLYSKILTYSQEEIEDEFVEAGKKLEKYPTPIEFLLGNSYNFKEYEQFAKNAFTFFLKEEVTFLYDEKKILIGNLKKILSQESTSMEDLIYISEEEFFDFQNIIRESIGTKKASPPDPNEHPRIKQMKAKQRLRDRVKAKEGKGITLFTSLVSICCMGLNINPLTIGEMSYVAIESIMNMYQDKEKYDLDIKTLLAGGDSKKIKPQYWIKNSEK